MAKMKTIGLAVALVTLCPLAASAGVGPEDASGYPPPPGPYRSGPWLGLAPGIETAQPADAAVKRPGILLPESAPAGRQDSGDYSATNLFGSPPVRETAPPAPPPALTRPEPLLPATPVPPREIPEVRPDFSIGMAPPRRPSDFSVDFSAPKRGTPRTQGFGYEQPYLPGTGSDADFAGLPSTLPDVMPWHDGQTPAPPSIGEAQPGGFGALPAWSAPPRPSAPPRAPENVAAQPSYSRLSPAPASPPPAVTHGGPVFRPPELGAD